MPLSAPPPRPGPPRPWPKAATDLRKCLPNPRFPFRPGVSCLVPTRSRVSCHKLARHGASPTSHWQWRLANSIDDRAVGMAVAHAGRPDRAATTRRFVRLRVRRLIQLKFHSKCRRAAVWAASAVRVDAAGNIGAQTLTSSTTTTATASCASGGLWA